MARDPDSLEVAAGLRSILKRVEGDGGWRTARDLDWLEVARGGKATSRESRYATGYRPPRMRLGAGQRTGGGGWRAAAGLDWLQVARGGKHYLEGVEARAGR